MKDILWNPRDHAWTSGCHVARFIDRNGLADLRALRRRSVEEPEWFWDAAVRDLGIEWTHPYREVRDLSGGFPWTRWFTEGQVNVAFNCLHRHVRGGFGGEVALWMEDEGSGDRRPASVSFAQLTDLVDRCAAGLRATGIGYGDSVALFAPMRLPTVVVLFAAMKIGARFVPIFCGYGEEALRERLASCEAKILFACRWVQRKGKRIDAGSVAAAAATALATPLPLVWIDGPEWDDFLTGGRGDDGFHPTQSEDPCLIIYTSGTTGRPKGAVHTHAGCLAQTGKELRYCFDARPGEPFFWMTDMGWMMGPWEVIGCLLNRTPVVLFDGAPTFPTAGRLWEICESIGVVTLGCSPTLIRMLMRGPEETAPENYDLSRLRILGSTGEVWDEPSYRWYFDRVGGGRCPVMNISGGTEILGCHLQPYPVEPLKACSLGGPALGMDVDIFDDEGRPARDGATGHLVCKQPAPSMTKGFLGDPARYLATYFSRFPGVWCHGDWARRDEDGQWFLHGRTDDTFKVGGKRIGAGEVEDALMSHPSVSEAAVIGVPDEIKGTVLVAFVRIVEGAGLHREDEIIAHVASRLGKALAPVAVHEVASLPKTRSGKVVRAMVSRVYLGQEAGDVSSVENPEALDEIRKFR